MKITKYNHACLLIEDNGKKLLIDPGMFTFNDAFKAEDIGPVDGIVITHPHEDHMAADAIKAVQALQNLTIVGGPAIKEALAAHNLEVQVVPQSQKQDIAGFTIESFAATHGPMPSETENFAYLINGRLLHPGDSYATGGLPQVEILAVPTQGPWARVVDSIEFGKTVKPKVALAIHNYLHKDDLTPWFDSMIGQQLEQVGIQFKSLQSGESWQG